MKMPHHVAIIMDGNGRWANKRGLPRIAGHKIGLESVRAVIKGCSEKKIEVLTLFAFSTENWERPKDEVGYLTGQLLVKALEEEMDELHKSGVQLRVIGEIWRLDNKLQQKIADAQKLTAGNLGLKLVIAISYSGRWDITEAVRKLCGEVAAGKIKADDITTEKIGEYISLHDLPEPDLLIRTGGEQRISNFMLWQFAYTELYFTDVLWPDFREKELVDALNVYVSRDRRFGKC
ncbi:MAG: Di-trans,poly-cis-decaprenylcistransferase [uncultured bacterium]|nr:MAG: Di-trans,poly-cis-decaprenylcistransferase [uncultured bacterium]